MNTVDDYENDAREGHGGTDEILSLCSELREAQKLEANCKLAQDGLRLIWNTLEELGPVGCMPNEEQCPIWEQTIQAIVVGIQKLADAHPTPAKEPSGELEKAVEAAEAAAAEGNGE